MEHTPYCPVAAVTPSALEVAQWVGGELREGDLAPAALSGLATLTDAEERDITFIASEKFLGDAQMSRAGLILTSAHWDIPGRARVVVGEVWEAVAQLMDRLYPNPAPLAEVHPTAVVGEHVRLGDGVSIGPYCVIGDDCELDDGVVLGPHCILDAGCRIGVGTRLVARVTLIGPVVLGQRVLIHSGAVLGTDGFKFELVKGRLLKIPQVGTVIVEDDVEIGANTTIDRAFLNETRIGRGTKIDNLSQIAHNVQIGPSCVMAAQVGIAGSTKVGAGCMMGGQVGIRDGIRIGSGVVIGAQAGVHTDMLKPGIFIGSPAMPIKEFWRMTATQSRLPEFGRRLRALEQKLEAPEGGPAGEKKA